MADIARIDFLNSIKKNTLEKRQALFLFYGERYLCKEAADTLQTYLLANDPGTVHRVDGSSEDAGQTLARLLSFSLLPGKQIYRVSDSRIFQSKMVLQKIWDKAFNAFQNGRTGAARQALLDMATLGELPAKALERPQVFSTITNADWEKRFGFEKPSESIAWADSMVSGGPGAEKGTPTNLVDAYIQAFDKGIPSNNILILTAETVDKRQRFFTYCKKQCITVDCTVVSGTNKAAVSDQTAVVQEQLQKTLASFHKKMANDAKDLFIQRVGCHPMAVIHEAEKLALFCENDTISRTDVETLTNQTREDALFELTEALNARRAKDTMAILARILQGGTHGLAIVATLRNFVRRLLLIRGVQLKHHQPWRAMDSRQFQNNYLPSLKENEDWAELIKGHPFAVYNNFQRAAEYSPASLKKQLCLIHETEFRIKSLFVPDKLLIEELVIGLLRTKKMGS